MENQATEVQILTRHSSQEEIKAQFGRELNTSSPVIYAVEQSPNKEGNIVLFIAQKQTSSGNMNAIQLMFMGLKNERIVRAVQTVPKANIESMESLFGGKLQPGTVLNGLGIRVEEHYNAAYAGQTPKQRTNDGSLVLRNGKPVYEHSKLDTVTNQGVFTIKEETNPIGLNSIQKQAGASKTFPGSELGGIGSTLEPESRVETEAKGE